MAQNNAGFYMLGEDRDVFVKLELGQRNSKEQPES